MEKLPRLAFHVGESDIRNKINELINDRNETEKRMEEAIRFIAGQVDYISAGHNMGITNKDEDYVAISDMIKGILKGEGE